jgi:tetratricopeptide (TPR) repeat protein
MELAQNNAIEAIKKKPGESKYHSLLAMLNLKTRDFDAARQEAAIALRINPRNFQAALLLAKSVLFAGDYDNAIKILEDMRKKAPDNIEVLGNLGLAYIRKKELDNAEAMFQKLLAIQPGNTLALMNIVRINAARGKDKAALIGIIKRQVAKAPESIGDLILLGTVLMQEKQYDEALAVLLKAQKLAPQNPRPYMLIASIYSRQNKLDDAVAQYTSLLKEHPRDTQAMMGLGALLEQKDDTAGAEKQYKQILKIKPDFAPAANNLAWIIAETPQPDLGEALRLAMIARQQLPDEVHIIDTTGWVHYKRKSYGLARNEFAHAVELQPDVPVFRYHLALALYGESKTEQAVKELETALKSEEKFPERKAARKQLAEWRRENNE